MFKIYDTSKSNTAKLSHVPSSFLRRVVYWLFSDNHAKMKHREYKRSSILPEKHAGNNQHLPDHKKYVHPIARFVVPHPFGSTDRHRLDIPLQSNPVQAFAHDKTAKHSALPVYLSTKLAISAW